MILTRWEAERDRRRQHEAQPKPCVLRGGREGLRYLDASKSLGEKPGNHYTHIGEVPKSTPLGEIILEAQILFRFEMVSI